MTASRPPIGSRLALGALLALTACFPPRTGYVEIPIVVPDGTPVGSTLRVELPWSEVRARLRRVRTVNLACWFDGREPIPHVFVDDDGDGAIDHVAVEIPFDGTHEPALAMSAPGPQFSGEPPPLAPTADTVLATPDFLRAQR